MPLVESRAHRLLALQLESQSALLPQALGIFGACLPVFVWLGAKATDGAFLALSFAIFAINWGLFYAVSGWLKTSAAADLERRARVQIGGALLWAAAAAQIAAFAAHAGEAQAPLLLCAAAVAVICVFFSAPTLAGLLIVGPAAMAGPLAVLLLDPGLRPAATPVWGGFALSFLLALVLNRSLRRQFALSADLEALATAREEARGQSEALARSKSDLLATLAGEVKTGLAGVVQVLRAASAAPMRAAPSREQLGAALTASEELCAIVGATLDHETLQAGELAFEARAFDIAAMAREAVAGVRQGAGRKGLELGLSVDPALDRDRGGAALGDPERARQVLAALLSNAVRYTARGRIEIRLQRRGEDRLELEVADTGPGLTAEELAGAFEPFRRIGRTAAGVAGAGLGLSVARRMAQAMGGSLEARSAPGAGSCFVFTLPFDPAARPGEAGEPAAADRRLKVLIAEDDALSAALLRALLEQLGHQAALARSGRRAVELVTALGFDLVMLAARLPDMAAHEAIAGLRRAGRAPIVAVIEGESEDADEAIVAMADAVARKPLSVAALGRAIAAAQVRETRAAA